MATYNYKSGLGNSAAYQVSGTPYLKGPIENAPTSGGPYKISFPKVTNWIKLSNVGGTNEELNFAFSANGLDGLTNAGAVLEGQILHLDLKVTELYYTGSCSSFFVAAGLTSIDTSQIDNDSISPAGNNWSGSANASVG